jgi:hypothetical protein
VLGPDLATTLAAAAAAGPPGSAAEQAGGGGSGGDEIDEIAIDTPEIDIQDDDELTGRILSLPNIMCRAANGDIFLVGLG